MTHVRLGAVYDRLLHQDDSAIAAYKRGDAGVTEDQIAELKGRTDFAIAGVGD